MKNNPFDKLRTSKGAVNLVLVILVVAVALVAGYFAFKNSGAPKTDQLQNGQVTIEQLVKSFGDKIKSVEKLLPEENIRNDIQENYSNFISKNLLNKWLANPQDVPGKTTSSPWPDRIEIVSIDGVDESEVLVRSNLIWKTSAGESKQAVNLSVIKKDAKWVIDTFVIAESDFEDPETSSWQTYRNEKYGFEFKYPNRIILMNTGQENGVFQLKSNPEIVNQSVKENLKQTSLTFKFINNNIEYSRTLGIRVNLKHPSDISLENYVPKSDGKGYVTPGGYETDWITVELSRKTEVDNEEAIEQVETVHGGPTSRVIYVLHQGSMYDIVFFWGWPDNLELDHEFKKAVISTFKFIQ